MGRRLNHVKRTSRTSTWGFSVLGRDTLYLTLYKGIVLRLTVRALFIMALITS